VFSVVLSVTYVLRVAIQKMKILQNRTVFVISTLFKNKEVRMPLYFYGRVGTSKKVGNPWF